MIELSDIKTHKTQLFFLIAKLCMALAVPCTVIASTLISFCQSSSFPFLIVLSSHILMGWNFFYITYKLKRKILSQIDIFHNPALTSLWCHWWSLWAQAKLPFPFPQSTFSQLSIFASDNLTDFVFLSFFTNSNITNICTNCCWECLYLSYKTSH